MTDKELRKLKRAELLEILYYLQKEVDNLKQENTELKERIENGGELSEGFAQKLEETVRKAVGDYFSQQSESTAGKEKKDKKRKSDSKGKVGEQQ